MLNKNLSGAFSVKSGPSPTAYSGAAFDIGDWGNQSGALTEPTILACLNLITSTISSLTLSASSGDVSLDKYSKTLPGELAVVLRRPNKSERTKNLIAKLVFNLVLEGEAFLQVKGSSKSIRSLECIPSGKCSRIKDGNGDWTFTGTDNQNNLIIPSEIIYLQGPQHNDRAFSFLEQGKSLIALSTAAIHNATSFNKRGPKAAGFALTDSKLTDENYNRLRGQLDRMTEDDSAGQIAILEKMSFVANPFSAKDAAIVETRSGVSKDLAALLGVPLQLLGFSESTFKDLEELKAVFMSSVIFPLIVEIEDAFNEAVGYRYTFDFLEEDLLNAQWSTRADIGMKLFSLGLCSKDEARSYADLNELKQGGDAFVAQSNNLVFSDSLNNTENGEGQ